MALNSSQACAEIEGINFTQFEIDQQPIVLLDHGNCSTWQKLRNVEKAGGRYAIFISDKNLEKGVLDYLDNHDPTGNENINIPGLVISKSDGEELRRFFHQKRLFSLKIDFPINQDNIVKVRIMYTSDDLNFYKILQDFESYEKKICIY